MSISSPGPETGRRQADRDGSEGAFSRQAPTDHELARKAAGGDVEAFSQLVRKNSGLVYRVATRILGAEDAQDASQEVWIQVWRKIRNFRGESAFSTWLYRITVNTCLSARRKEKDRDVLEFGGELPYLPASVGNEDDPETAALDEERREELLRALERVRAEHRAALVLRHMEGLGYAKIAEILDVPPARPRAGLTGVEPHCSWRSRRSGAIRAQIWT
jgi:RNA polymerase sigma-70 factor (ECF subfamily)